MDYSGCEHTENATRLTNSSSIGSVQRFFGDAGKVRLSDLKLHDIFEKASA